MKALVRRAEAEVLDAKVGDEALKVVALMPLAVAMKRQTMVGTSMVMREVRRMAIC